MTHSSRKFLWRTLMAQLKYILLALGAALATAYFGLGVNVPRLHFILGKV